MRLSRSQGKEYSVQGASEKAVIRHDRDNVYGEWEQEMMVQSSLEGLVGVNLDGFGSMLRFWVFLSMPQRTVDLF